MFRVSARTILELGSELISSDIIAFYELIKNGFDAGSKTGVAIYFEILIRKNKFISLREIAKSKSVALESLKKEAIQALNSDATPERLKEATDHISGSNSHEEFIENLVTIHGLNRILVKDTGSGMTADELVRNFLTIGTSSRRKAVDQAIQSKAGSSPFLGEKA